MPGRENNSEPCIAAHHQVVRLCGALEREHLVIDRMPVRALKCLLRPNTLGSMIAGLIHREGKRLIAQVVGNFAGMFALEPDLCARVGAGRGILRLPPLQRAHRTIA